MRKEILLVLSLFVLLVFSSTVVFADEQCHCEYLIDEWTAVYASGCSLYQDGCTDANCPGYFCECAVHCNGGFTCGNMELEWGEVCDYSEGTYPDGPWLLNGHNCVTEGFDTGQLKCQSECLNFDTSECITTCGDGDIDLPHEQCDGTALGGQTCISRGFDGGTLGCYPVLSTNRCHFDTSQCLAADCGDGICMAETNQTCFRDCPIPGWHTDTIGPALRWGGSDNNLLIATIPNAFFYSDYIDIKNNTRYALSGKMYMNTPGCTANIILDGECLSQSGFIYRDCFNDVVLTTSTPQNTMQSFQNPNIVITQNQGTHVFDGYYNNVRVILSVTDVTPGSCVNPTIYFDDISLKDVSNLNQGIFYDVPVGAFDAQSSCCPSDWCWNGTTCVDSTPWMISSAEPPIWNIVFNIPWLDQHINSTYQNKARGYRCVNDTATGIANWKPANIKYDWNFKGAGYCNNVSDCFVNRASNFGEGRAGCIHSGEFVSDSFVRGEGNHYCNNGVWSTRTQVMANFLASIAGSTTPYVLFCDNNTNMYNLFYDPILSFSDIAGACTVVIRESNSDEQIITAFFVNGNPRNIIYNLVERYRDTDANGGDFTWTIASGWNVNSDCAPLYSGFSKCIGDEPFPTTNLDIYYNSHYNFFFLSEEDVSIVDPSVWIKIRDFFKRLFRIPIQTPRIGLFNQTTNFDNIFIINNGTASELYVFAVQEGKYDELEKKMFNYTYINYSDTHINLRNTLNLAYLYNLYGVNISINNSNFQGVVNGVNAYGTQEVYIRSDKKSILWPYLTAYLRDRSIPNP